ALLAPLPIKIVVDSVLGARPLPTFVTTGLPTGWTRTPAAVLLVAIGLLLAVVALTALQNLASTLLRAWVGERLVLDFRSRLVDRIQRLSPSYHETRGSADAIYRIQYDAPAIQNLLVEGVIPAVSAAFTIVTMIAVTARLDGRL